MSRLFFLFPLVFLVLPDILCFAHVGISEDGFGVFVDLPIRSFTPFTMRGRYFAISLKQENGRCVLACITSGVTLSEITCGDVVLGTNYVEMQSWFRKRVIAISVLPGGSVAVIITVPRDPGLAASFLRTVGHVRQFPGLPKGAIVGLVGSTLVAMWGSGNVMVAVVASKDTTFLRCGPDELRNKVDLITEELVSRLRRREVIKTYRRPTMVVCRF